jgi:hypothetical protein
MAHPAGVAHATERYVGWGDAFIDINNSGWQDLILVNGHVYPQVDSAKLGIHYLEPALVFLNQHNGTFREATATVSPTLTKPQVSRGLAVGDLFNRGALDVVIENLTGGPLILSSKPSPANHWITVELHGNPKNALALNARVRVTANGVTQLQEVRSGGSYLSQSDLRLHFGLGAAATIDTLEIEWQGGANQLFKDVEVDRFYSCVQGGGLQVRTYRKK